MITQYPEFSKITLDDHAVLHAYFRQVQSGISEFTFANIYLFRHTHNYKISKIKEGLFVLAGNDDGKPFFVLPTEIPDPDILEELFNTFHSLKLASEQQAKDLQKAGYFIREDRDNFDYLYSRETLATLSGRKFSKKRNLIKNFKLSHTCDIRPLLNEYTDDALRVLKEWCNQRGRGTDCEPAREALEEMETLQLCGAIFYIENRPVGYTLGEELPGGKTYVIHFEKAVPGFKGLYQFINQSFAALLPEQYEFINREQDLGDKGLRQAKLSYYPIGFVKKYRVYREPGETENVNRGNHDNRCN
ncbi:MAG: DUF2156 domain-containing protein [Calditrichaeota bacterium]|nr:DUF2156 domain-containing protein [Calditrichota bacterium]